jgi:hypothetical protein
MAVSASDFINERASIIHGDCQVEGDKDVPIFGGAAFARDCMFDWPKFDTRSRMVYSFTTGSAAAEKPFAGAAPIPAAYPMRAAGL